MKRFLLTLVAVFAVIGVAHAGYDHATQDVAAATAATASSLDSECMIPAYDVTNEDGIFIACDDVGGLGDDDATKAEINRVADDSNRINLLSTETVSCATHGTGQINYFSAATDTTVTLPAATGTGCVFYFTWSTLPAAATQSGDVIQVTGTDEIRGILNTLSDGSNAVLGWALAGGADNDKLTFTSSTKFVATKGVWIELTDFASGVWHIRGQGYSTGSEATPAATGQRS